MTLRIAVDGHMVGQRETGNETYVLGRIGALARLDHEGTYCVLVSGPVFV